MVTGETVLPILFDDLWKIITDLGSWTKYGLFYATKLRFQVIRKSKPSSRCYKTFLGGNLENLEFPISWNSKNKQF